MIGREDLDYLRSIEPSPRINLPSDKEDRVIAVIAVMAGVLAVICMIAVPSFMVWSLPQGTRVPRLVLSLYRQTVSTPIRSACT